MQESLLRFFLTLLLKLFFRVRVRGLEHFERAGERVIIIANHQSFLDPLLLAVLVPKKPAFVMNLFQAEKWYFRWVEKVTRIYKIDPSQSMSMKRLLTDLKDNMRVVIFPEGRITTSGGVMKIYDGTAMIANKTGAAILPIHIEGTQYSTLSRLGGKLRQRLFPQITVTFYPPVQAKQGAEFSSGMIYDLLTYQAYDAQNRHRSLLSAILEGRSVHGKKKIIATDITRQEMNYKTLFLRSFILSSKLKNYLHGQQHVAMLLPNSLAALVTFISLHMLHKIPCMLNFSSGSKNILHACHIAQAKTVLTSRAFIEKGSLEHLITGLEKEYVIIYLEDIRETIGGMDKIVGLMKSLMPSLILSRVIRQSRPYEPAVVLYTSGSEGTPKGVALSHTNILANIYQAAARLDLMPSDKLFNALPVFHSFGLTVGMLMPLVKGVSTFLYPSPLHYRMIPELIYDTDSTIMVGTDTFYQGYARHAHPYDFRSIRLAVAGAEKLREHTRKLYADKFSIPIREGYGVTETSPVIACNTALYHKAETVGRVFPGMQLKLEPVEGIEQGGRLWVKGDNVMLGYIKEDKPGIIQPQTEWYDTGDIVDIDEEGFVTILGRAKRFAKVAGEMVSLAAVEDFMHRLWPEVKHAAVAVPDERKGERVVLVTEMAELNRQKLSSAARDNGVPEIFMPKHIVVVEEIPLLGSGKYDYSAIQKLALAEMAD